ncbi:MAG: carbohydrate-binding domain-containing protein, partial [Anaerolineae bacterium]|nr:carbohydrate-binding domain-containing protein [Anaerolineae bacterium]
MRKLWTLLFVMVFALTACSVPSARAVEITPVAQSAGSVEAVSTAEPKTVPTTDVTLSPIEVEYDADDGRPNGLDTSADSAITATIELDGDTIDVEGAGVIVDAVDHDGARVTITAAGTYAINGALDDGQIVVDAGDEDVIVLVLNGAQISCSTGAPITIVNAEKAIITLASGTENSVTDGDAFVLEEGSDEPNAAIFSHDDLTINGSGALTVNATYHAGIVSKDDLKITGGTLTVNALNDGIKGRDSLVIKAGTVTVNAGGDGLEASNDEETEKGTIVIEDGTLSITAGLDGIQAETRLQVDGGILTITSGGGSANGSDHSGWGVWGRSGNGEDAGATDSAKGLKAGQDVTITDGNITIDASDDAIHSNGSVTISAGNLLLASGDDGVHADATLTIDGGSLTITQSYEGIESAMITINDGDVHIVASDDGINVSGGSDGSAMGGRPGQNDSAVSGTDHLYLNGGTVVVDAGGDGIDANSPIDMTGGTVIVN